MISRNDHHSNTVRSANRPETSPFGEDAHFDAVMREAFEGIGCAFRERHPGAELPGRSSLTADAIVDRVTRCYDMLAPLHDRYLADGNVEHLGPGLVTNYAFSELVRISTKFYDDGVVEGAARDLGPDVAARIRAFCAVGEAAMERYFARHALEWLESDPARNCDIIRTKAAAEVAGVDPASARWQVEFRSAMLRAMVSPPGTEFPYFDNYVDMVSQGEIKLLDDLTSRRAPLGRTVAFLGSGPLDLSSDLLLINFVDRDPYMRITCVDKDPEAVHLSRALLGYKERLGIIDEGSKSVVHGDAASTSFGREPPHVKADVVFIASMIPCDVRDKVLENIAASGPDGAAAVMVRDAFGMSGHLLYDRVDREAFRRKGLTLTAAAHPVQHMLRGDVSILPGDDNVPVSPLIVNSTWAGAFEHEI